MKLIGIGLKAPVAIRTYIGSASPSSVNRNAMAVGISRQITNVFG